MVKEKKWCHLLDVSNVAVDSNQRQEILSTFIIK